MVWYIYAKKIPIPPPSVILNPSGATEAAAGATYKVQPGGRPKGTVRIQMETPSGPAFSTGNWNTARVIT